MCAPALDVDRVSIDMTADAMELRGGDLMIDEPVREDRALEPDDAKFVMPQRDQG